MRREGIERDLEEAAFEFFYRFSRFEFTLKENGFLRSKKPGANAEPSWDDFIDAHEAQFNHTPASKDLLKLNPRRQKISANGTLEWQDVGLEDCKNELCKVVRLIKTVRNNLFHGGKHSADGWDDPLRSKLLLHKCSSILDHLADEAGFEADYTRRY
jgi:hypothetical protein